MEPLTEKAVILMDLFLVVHSMKVLQEVIEKKVSNNSADELDLEVKRLLDSGLYEQLKSENTRHE